MTVGKQLGNYFNDLDNKGLNCSLGNYKKKRVNEYGKLRRSNRVWWLMKYEKRNCEVGHTHNLKLLVLHD